MVACGAADGGEPSGEVDGVSGYCNRKDDLIWVGGVPVGECAGCVVDCGDILTCVAADGGEVATEVDGGTGFDD